MCSSVQTNEGLKAYDEAIALLKKSKPMREVEVARPMCKANTAHVKDIGATGATGHKGADGSKAAQRLRNNGGAVQGGGAIKECIEFGPWIDGADFVVALIVGDGEQTRTHRKILLDHNLSSSGMIFLECLHLHKKIDFHFRHVLLDDKFYIGILSSI